MAEPRPEDGKADAVLDESFFFDRIYDAEYFIGGDLHSDPFTFLEDSSSIVDGYRVCETPPHSECIWQYRPDENAIVIIVDDARSKLVVHAEGTVLQAPTGWWYLRDRDAELHETSFFDRTYVGEDRSYTFREAEDESDLRLRVCEASSEDRCRWQFLPSRGWIVVITGEARARAEWIVENGGMTLIHGEVELRLEE
jgi:hypothetical protein